MPPMPEAHFPAVPEAVPEAASVDEFQGELDQSRLVRLTVDNAKLRRPECHSGVAEPDPIEDVEELRPELEIDSALLEERIILGHAEIQIIGAVIAHVRQRSRSVAECESGGLAEYTRVKETREASAGIALQLGALAIIIRARSSAE